MLKRSFFTLLFAATMLLQPGDEAKLGNPQLIAQTNSVTTHSAQTTTSESKEGRRHLSADATDSNPADLVRGPLAPYADHAALPAGAIYTTSDETA